MDPKPYTEEIDFQKYWLVLKRRWLPAAGVFVVVTTLSVLKALSINPTYQANGKLLIKTEQLSNLTGVGSDLGGIETTFFQNKPLDTQVEIVRSVPVMQQAIATLGLKDEEGKPLSPLTLAATVNAEVLTGTDVIEITYKHRRAKRSAAVVNAVMNAYIENNILSNRAEAAAAREFIVEQLPRAEASVSEAEGDLREFKEANQLVTLEDEAREAIGLVSTIEEDVTNTAAQLADARARARAIQRQIELDVGEAVDLAALSQSPGVQEVLTRLQTVQSDLAVERTRYTDNHPTVSGLDRQSKALEALLQTRIQDVLGPQSNAGTGEIQLTTLQQQLVSELVAREAERSGLENRLVELRRLRAFYRGQANDFPRLEENNRELERRLEVAQSTYEALLTRLQEIRVAENQNVGNARVIAEALVPERPLATAKKLTVLSGVVGGIVLGLVTAFLLDLIDRSLKTIREAQSVFDYTLLGVVPVFDPSGRIVSSIGDPEPNPGRIIVKTAPRSPASKAYQMLQANLTFLSSDNPMNTMVVSSSVAGEGRSEVAANLATVTSQTGRRVLLVDADMRHPAQHHLWDLTNSFGLSNVLVDQVDFGLAVQSVMPNLSVLTAGVMPPNPLELIDSERMATLVQSLSKDYDVVIFDTPSLAGNADAAILAKMTDGILMVVRPGIVDFESARASRDFLDRSGQIVLGMIANGVQVGNEPDSYFHYTEEPFEPNNGQFSRRNPNGLLGKTLSGMGSKDDSL